MKILLDSKDLIDIVEHGRPVMLEDFRNYLHDHDSSLVLTFNNSRELAAPLAQGIDALHVRDLLQRLETLPLSYLGEVKIPTDEVKQAVRTFNSATEYNPINPWVSRWDETMPGPKPAVGKMLILRLEEIVLDIARVDASVFSGYSFYEEAPRQQFENDRRISPAARVPEYNFPKVVGRLIEHYGIEKPNGPLDDLAAWIYKDPCRCPGFRLGYEVFHELLKNVGDEPEASDISDISHINAIPYVDAATLDRRMHGYCSQVSRKLQKVQSAIDYADRMFPDLKTLLSAKP